MPLDTIKDFDFGVGGSDRIPRRVADSPTDVSECEVKFIVWLLLEQEFQRVNRTAPAFIQKGWGNRTQHDGSQLDEDEDDCDDEIKAPPKLSIGGECLRKAREFAEVALREAGVDLMFDELQESTRHTMILQLCRGSGLLQGDSFRSVPDIFQTLRSASRFRSLFERISDIGSGGYGEVSHVRRKLDTSRQEYAIKKISVSTNSIKEVKMAITESKILKMLKGHANVIELHDYWLEIEPDLDPDYVIFDGLSNSDEEDDPSVGPLKFYIQLEFCHINLHEWKEENFKNGIKNLNISDIVSIARQLFGALEYIHGKKVLHLDIKPKNVMWKDTTCTRIKIIDFGLAVVGTSCKHRGGTPPYAAPQSECPMTVKSDVYSAAVTVIEIANTVYTINELTDLIQMRKADTGEPVLDNLLYRAMDLQSPENRPSAIEFIETLDNIAT
ncbi:unnamed protein product [Orchesella dallaii]|uniref:Protein kinase domain-containing protein n=1 Tax=Orchesella dallaii TaxID=48710 RepID=A0ABP1PZ34_9HEXA